MPPDPHQNPQLACLGESSTRMVDLLGIPPTRLPQLTLYYGAFSDPNHPRNSPPGSPRLRNTSTNAPDPIRTPQLSCLGESSTRMGDLLGSPRAVLWDLVGNKKDEKQHKKEKNVKKRCNTRTSQEVTHPSTTLAQPCLTADAGMIAPVKCCTINVYMASAAGISVSTWEDAGERSYVDGLVVQHEDFPGGHPSSDGIRCISAGMIAPVKCCTINVYMASAAGISFNTWEDAGERSYAVLWDLVGNNSDGIRCISAGMIAPSSVARSMHIWIRQRAVLWDLVANNKEEKQRKKEKNVKKLCNTRTSQEVTHPSTTLAQARFTSDAGMIALVKCCTINVYMASEVGISFSTWKDVGDRSYVDGLGLPRRSPILVLLSPKHALLRSSDGIQCISAVLHDQCIYGFGSGYKFQHLERRGRSKLRGWFGSEKAIAVLWDLVANKKDDKQRKKEKNVKKRWNTRTSQEHAELRSSDGIRCISAGMIAPVKFCTINVYMDSAAGISFNTWEDAGERSDMDGLEKNVKKRCNTRTSQEVTHPSTTLAQPCLTADAGMIAPVKCCTINVYMASAAGISVSTWEDAGERSYVDGLEKNVKKWCNTRTSQEVTHRSTTLAQARLTADAGMIAPVKCCTINVYMASAAGISFNTWEDAGERSDMDEKQRKKEKNVKKRCNTRTSQEVTHPSTTLAQPCLTADARMIAPVKCCTINVYMASAAGISFSPWEDAGERSYVDGLAVLWDLVANNKKEKQRKKEKNVKKGATRELPRSSDGIRCISAGMITPVKCCTISVYMNSAVGISCNTWEDAGERSDVDGLEKNVKKWCNTRTSQEVTHRSTTLAQARLTADAGMIAPVKCCTINVYMASAAGISFNTWEDAGERSDMDGATRGLPRRSPILVLLSPKHALLRSSDGIQCISAVLHDQCIYGFGSGYKFQHLERRGRSKLRGWFGSEKSIAVLWDLVANNKDEKQRKKEKSVKKKSNTRTSQEVTHSSTTLAQARLTAEYCMINVYMASAAGISFNNWENAGKLSDVYGVGPKKP
ncbi:hypothetical protein V8G54_034825 [Vigna mungo]|uniref:Uncharacterized protein n=1 Tax=Vigna mungo TaxID=3915 RepID=A0AAQ3MDV3_VIGMU